MWKRMVDKSPIHAAFLRIEQIAKRDNRIWGYYPESKTQDVITNYIYTVYRHTDGMSYDSKIEFYINGHLQMSQNRVVLSVSESLVDEFLGDVANHKNWIAL